MVRVAVALCFSLSVAGADLTQLRQLEESKRFFELRRVLIQTADNGPEVLYYRALTEARFGQEMAAIQHLRAFLATNPDPTLKREAHEALGSAFMGLNQYKNAGAEWNDALELMPQDDPARDDTETGRAICETLRDVAPQTIEFADEAPLKTHVKQLGLWTAPMQVNGKNADWIMDTGASMSVLSESEAKRLGLQLRDSGGTVGSGHTGIQSRFRLAVAPEMRIGRARLHNVIFVVVADRAMRFGPLGWYRLPGLVGLPVIRALGLVRFSANGELRFEPESPKIEGNPNFLLDDLSPIVEILHAGRAIPMFIDTGGNVSYMYPSFRDELTPEERSKLTRHKGKSGGVGGTISIETDTIATLQLELPGKVVTLNKISLRLGKPQLQSADGLLGMDALKNGFTLDFRAMRVKLD